MNALQANPDVRAAAVYDATGALFVSYSRTENEQLPTTVAMDEPRFENNHLVVTTPVVQENSVLGIVYLDTVVEPLERRVLRFGVVALSIGVEF